MSRRRKSGTTRNAPIPKPKDQVVGRRFIRLIEDHLKHLHKKSCHGNRTLHLDQLAVAHLLAFFNPGIRGLRTIEDIFDVPIVRKRFNIRRMPKSTVSDSQRVLDPELLLPMLDSLKERANIQEHDHRLDALTKELMAVDGSLFTMAARVSWAVYNQSSEKNNTKGAARIHLHFDVLRAIPTHVTLTHGQASETQQLEEAIRGGCLYVMDRGYEAYGMLHEIMKADSDFVARLRKTACYRSIQARPLTANDRLCGILSDDDVRVGWRDSETPFTQPLRLVEIAQADKPDEPVRLLTTCMDLPAETIGLIYRHRWQIELFFRWLKCMANFQHFFSESQQGMTLQIYIALIGTLLIAIETGAKPSKYDYALLSMAASGFCPLEEALAQAAKRRAERQRAKERARAKAAEKKKK